MTKQTTQTVETRGRKATKNGKFVKNALPRYFTEGVVMTARDVAKKTKAKQSIVRNVIRKAVAKGFLVVAGSVQTEKAGRPEVQYTLNVSQKEAPQRNARKATAELQEQVLTSVKSEPKTIAELMAEFSLTKNKAHDVVACMMDAGLVDKENKKVNTAGRPPVVVVALEEGQKASPRSVRKATAELQAQVLTSVKSEPKTIDELMAEFALSKNKAHHVVSCMVKAGLVGKETMNVKKAGRKPVVVVAL